MTTPSDRPEDFMGEWVATMNGRVVDHDPDPGVLYTRLSQPGAPKQDRFYRMVVDSDDFF